VKERRQSIEAQQAEARRLPEEADATLVTFRNLNDCLRSAVSRLPPEQRTEAYSFIAVEMLRNRMGKPIGGSINFSRAEWKRHHKQDNHKQIPPLDTYEVAKRTPAPQERHHDHMEERDWIESMLDQLKPREAMLIRLTLDNHELRDCAEQLGMTVGSTYHLMLRARGKLQWMAENRLQK
jgi:RNA polymerase sigma factor (sigma-70 family)